MLDLYTVLLLDRQHWTDQYNENESAPAVFVFLKWSCKDCMGHELPTGLVPHDKKYLNETQTQ